MSNGVLKATLAAMLALCVLAPATLTTMYPQPQLATDMAFAAEAAPATPAAPAAPAPPPDPKAMIVPLPAEMANMLDPNCLHYAAATKDGSAIYPDYPQATAAYKWLDILEEVTARDVGKVGARPTIISRQMAIVMTAIYDAWAAYDEKAVGTRLGGKLRRPAAERSDANKEKAITYAAFDALNYAFPDDKEYIAAEMTSMGYDPADMNQDATSPVGVGHQAAAAVIAYRSSDGSNQDAKMAGSAPDAKPYADYTGYKPVNAADSITDADHWQPITFTKPNGDKVTPGYLTPQWGMVKTLALDSSDQFRPAGPPKSGSKEMEMQVMECVRYNAGMTPMQKATVEFMRDGPRSTGQSGHWLRFAQDLSRRDHYNLDQDVKLFFSVANICMDTFIACWECKRFYDSSRPWTLVHNGDDVFIYDGSTIRGRRPGQGEAAINLADWHPYSPDVFITPPFPGYPSGHSTVSAGASTILKLFSGSDYFGFVALRVPGCLTGEPMAEPVCIELPSWSATAEMAGISRVMGGYHIQSDNMDALALGRKIANFEWPRYQEYFNGTATVRP